MNPGKFNNVIEFFIPSKTADGYGGTTLSSFTSTATIWGFATEISGNIEQSEGSRKYNRVSEIIVRKKDFDLVSLAGAVFNIDGAGKYRINEHYEIIEKYYVKFKGTYEPI